MPMYTNKEETKSVYLFIQNSTVLIQETKFDSLMINWRCGYSYEPETPLQLYKSISTIQQSHSWVFTQMSWKAYIHTKIYTEMIIEAFLILVKTWKQTRCPSIHKSINKYWYIPYNRMLFSHEKTRGALNAFFLVKKPVWKGYILSDSNYITFWKRKKYRRGKKSHDCPRFWGQGGIGRTQGIFKEWNYFVTFCNGR